MPTFALTERQVLCLAMCALVCMPVGLLAQIPICHHVLEPVFFWHIPIRPRFDDPLWPLVVARSVHFFGVWCGLRARAQSPEPVPGLVQLAGIMATIAAAFAFLGLLTVGALAR